MTAKIKRMTLTACMAVLMVSTTFARAELTPQALLEKSDEARGNTTGIQWKIALDSVENGRRQHRELQLTAKDVRSLAKFLAPAKVKGQKILMIDRNMWFIKPGLRKPVPISPRQKLMGGASYGDIASTNYAGDYQIMAAQKEVINGKPCLRLTLAAKDKKVTYDRIDYWISTIDNVGIKADFFTISGKRFKSAVFTYENRIEIHGKLRPFVSKMTITDALIGQNITTLSYSEVNIASIPDAAFNLNLLVR
jgi:hypothetical protein